MFLSYQRSWALQLFRHQVVFHSSRARRSLVCYYRKYRSLGTPPRRTFQARLLHNQEGANAEKGGFRKISSRAFFRRVSIGVYIFLVVEQSILESQSRWCAKTPILTVLVLGASLKRTAVGGEIRVTGGSCTFNTNQSGQKEEACSSHERVVVGSEGIKLSTYSPSRSLCLGGIKSLTHYLSY